MIKKLCSACKRVAWGNPMKKEKDQPQQYRCTFCGHPVANHIGSKKDYALAIQKKQASKPV